MPTLTPTPTSTRTHMQVRTGRLDDLAFAMVSRLVERKAQEMPVVGELFEQLSPVVKGVLRSNLGKIRLPGMQQVRAQAREQARAQVHVQSAPAEKLVRKPRTRASAKPKVERVEESGAVASNGNRPMKYMGTINLRRQDRRDAQESAQ